MSLKNVDVRIQPNVNLAPVIQLNQYMNETIRAFQQTDKATADWRDSLTDVNKHMGQTSKYTNQMQTQFKNTRAATKSMIDESQALNNQLGRQSDVIRALAKTSGTTATQLAMDWQAMSGDMRKSLINNHNEMLKYRQQVVKVEYDMYKLGTQMGHYAGSTNDFMKEVHQLGQEHKKATDQMLNNNVTMRRSIIEQVATMSAMSGQSEKIAGNYDRVSNTLLRMNNPLLGITARMEKMARDANAAALALQMLGPNASMKALQDQIKLINQGVMRMQAVVLVAAVAWVGFTAIVANTAKGPDVQNNLESQSQALADYRNVVRERTAEIANAWGIFEKVQLEKTSPQLLMSNLQEQVRIMQNWSSNLNELASKGLDEGFIANLREMGPKAASEIASLNRMSQPQLDQYVNLWKQKHQLAKQAATTELQQLKQNTEAKIKELQKSLTPLGVSLYEFKHTWADAVKPFVEFWGRIASKIVDAGTYIGKFINKLNEISPWITRIAGMFLYLVTTFTLLLAPLAIGIGYFMGLKAAFAAAWVYIGPLVTGLGAMMGTVLLVSAAVIALGAALYLLWTRSETFRNAVINGWTAIKNKAIEVWGFLKPYINKTIEAVSSFVQQKMNQLKAFWDGNGQQILQAVKNVWGAISPIISTVMNTIWSVMQFVWPLVLALIKSVWGNIKGVISGALNIIMGLVKVFSGLFTGDFSKMWEGLKQIFFGAVQFIWNFVQLQFFGRVLSLGKGFVVGFKNVMVGLWNGLKSLFSASVNSVKSFVVTGFTGMKSIATNLLTGMKNSAVNIWTNLKGGVSNLVTGTVNGIRNGWTTAKNKTFEIFNSIKTKVSQTFTDVVNGAKALPGKIGQGIKSMAGKVTDGVKALTNKLVGTLGKGVNGAITGVNWVLDKIGVKTKIKEWSVPEYASGTEGHPGGLAILGDGGMKELYVTPTGQMGMSPATDTLMNLPRGTKVFSGPQTKMLIETGVIPQYKNGNVGDWLKAKGKAALNTAGKAKDAVVDTAKSGASKAKDLALDVWSYASDPVGLMKKVFAKFIPKLPNIGGAFDNIVGGSVTKVKNNFVTYIKKKMKDLNPFEGGSGATGPAGKGASRWRSAILAAAARMNESVSEFDVQGIIAQIHRESGGNQNIVQSPLVRDINTRNGNPARGLLQYIPQTFRSYAVKGHNNIYSGYDQLLAFFNNTTWRRDNPRGARGWGPRGRRKYADGTNFHPGGSAILGDGFRHEPFLLPNGSLGLSPNVPTVFSDLPVGTKVWPSVKDFFKQHNRFKQREALGDNVVNGDKPEVPHTFNDATTVTKTEKTLVYNPTINIYTSEKDNSEGKTTKEEFQEMLDDHYRKMQELMDL
ncbi:hypothetical protein ACTHAL_001465 [Priestia flexa]|uniref:hypothetical protein n=1 Tax=Priestia flexa TaxID=86664 RepID=UPI003F828A3B